MEQRDSFDAVADLYDRMTAAVAEHGGVYRAPWETHLYAARRRGGAG